MLLNCGGWADGLRVKLMVIGVVSSEWWDAKWKTKTNIRQHKKATKQTVSSKASRTSGFCGSGSWSCSFTATMAVMSMENSSWSAGWDDWERATSSFTSSLASRFAREFPKVMEPPSKVWRVDTRLLSSLGMIDTQFKEIIHGLFPVLWPVLHTGTWELCSCGTHSLQQRLNSGKAKSELQLEWVDCPQGAGGFEPKLGPLQS